MIRFWSLLLLATAAAFGAQQAPSSPAPQQPSADQTLTKLLMDSDQKKVMGDTAGAIKGYETALARVGSEPAIRNREEEVLQRLSAGYIASRRYQEAVTVSRRILALHQADCKPGAPFLERCADAQYGLGLALMYTEDFTQAAAELNRSVANFGGIGGPGDELTRMNRLKNLGSAESLLGAALFRAGDKEKAVATIRRAIANLKIVADDAKLDPATRGSARKSMQDAQASLNLLEPAQAPAKR
ncbi:MAG: tetratricopeptide repeat protein [Acidobacteria bacterium]|nr:tetratricopeptide repeat protein [Acidobacteriota bacterium]